MGQNPHYSLKSFAWLDRSDPAQSYWRTSQLCFLEGWQRFSQSWPRSGLMQSGIAYQLPQSEHPINATEFLSSPGEDRCKQRPTEQKTGGYAKVATPGFFQGVDATTASGIAKTAESTHIHSTTAETMGAYIAGQTTFPTPSANEDAAGTPNGKMQKMLGNDPRVRNTGDGVLNPEWVEWLMGFGIGYTDLNV